MPDSHLYLTLRLGGLPHYAASPTMRLSTTDGSAFAWLSSHSLVEYLGRRLTVEDSAGKQAIGYIKEADAAEALGANLYDAAASVFTAGTYAWTAYGTNTIANDTNSLRTTYVDNVNGAFEYLKDADDLSADLTVGKLYKFVLDAKVGAGDDVNIQIVSSVEILTSNVTETAFTSKVMYFTADATTTMYIKSTGLGAGEIIWFDNLVLKEVTDVGTDGVHIVSALGGATRNWTSIDSGFDPNDVASVTVH